MVQYVFAVCHVFDSHAHALSGGSSVFAAGGHVLWLGDVFECIWLFIAEAVCGNRRPTHSLQCRGSQEQCGIHFALFVIGAAGLRFCISVFHYLYRHSGLVFFAGAITEEVMRRFF